MYQSFNCFRLSTSSTTNAQTGIITTPLLASMPVLALPTGGQVFFNVDNITGAPITVYVWGTLAGGVSASNSYSGRK